MFLKEKEKEVWFLLLSFSCIGHHIDVEGAGRGAIAMEDLEVGDIAMEIPASIIISEDLVHKSDMVYFISRKICISSLLFVLPAFDLTSFKKHLNLKKEVY